MERRTVPKSYYDIEYWLTDNEGYEEFIKSSGQTLSPRIRRSLELGKVKKDMLVMDLGSGRGELVINCAFCGCRAIGLEPSDDGIKLAREAMKKIMCDIRERILLIKGDGYHLPFKDKVFDRIFMLDIVEELYPEELEGILSEVRRVLKGNGKLIIHTMPNRWFLDIGHRYYLRYIYIVLNPLVKKFFHKTLFTGKNPRGHYDTIMHVNEQTYSSLKRTLESAGFEAKVWVNDFHVVKDLKSFLFTLLRFPVWPIKLILGNNIWAEAQPEKRD